MADSDLMQLYSRRILALTTAIPHLGALPAFDGKPDRYVLWGEGTTDEMCLGIVMVTRP